MFEKAVDAPHLCFAGTLAAWRAPAPGAAAGIPRRFQGSAALRAIFAVQVHVCPFSHCVVLSNSEGGFLPKVPLYRFYVGACVRPRGSSPVLPPADVAS